LVGEAALCGDRGEWPLWVAKQLAGCAKLKLLLIFSGRSILEATKRPSQVNGMDSGFAREISHPQPL
jgi:hypothetical protein